MTLEVIRGTLEKSEACCVYRTHNGKVSKGMHAMHAMLSNWKHQYFTDRESPAGCCASIAGWLTDSFSSSLEWPSTLA
eukprot:scaffold185133_cov24-Prasinocladus_malaysianus.AAC.1